MNRVSGCGRRDFLYTASLTLLLSACNEGKGKKQAASSAQPQDTRPTAALSLAALQEHSKGKLKWPGSQDSVLPGINRITGFLVDGSDVVLFGRQEHALPAIELDAFVVALRNAFGAGDAVVRQSIARAKYFNLFLLSITSSARIAG